MSFPELVRAKFLSPGEEILCRTLKHQQRGGADRFIGGARVATDGTVEYKGERYSVPSKLAVRMVNDSGGKTEALNGYDYIFVRTTAGIVSLSELRERFLGQAS